jgi:Ca-activated chloride channel family protein
MIKRILRKVATLAVLGFLLPAPHVLAAEQVKVDVAMAKPYLLAGQKQTNYLRVGLTGLPIAGAARRTPVNLAIVLDKSGSMTGDKLRKAKDAAIASIDRLGADDIVSVIAYDHTVEVLVPATKVSDRALIRNAIERLVAGGNTALFAGVSKGAAEVRKFLDRQRVNRIILLSDGQANSGPSSPADLGDLGASLIKEGISVTTLGLGLDYNEDLMTALARRSDGNNYFIESTTELAAKFDFEFNDVMSVVAQEVTVRITCAPGVRPIRVLGREADITGQTVTAYLNQVYGEQEKYVLLEVEVPAGSDGARRNLADVAVSYVNMAAKAPDKVTRAAGIRFAASPQLVDANTNRAVMASAIEQIAVEKNQLAISLRDQGRVADARRVLQENAAFLAENARRLESKELASYGNSQAVSAERLDEQQWNVTRKSASNDINMRQSQQASRIATPAPTSTPLWVPAEFLGTWAASPTDCDRGGTSRLTITQDTVEVHNGSGYVNSGATPAYMAIEVIFTPPGAQPMRKPSTFTLSKDGAKLLETRGEQVITRSRCEPARK